MKFGLYSKCGKRNQINEDCVFASSEFGLYIVCDGMGGHAAGELASFKTVDFLSQELKLALKPQMNEKEIELILRDRLQKANQFILDYAKSNPDYKEMGTTVVLAYLAKNKLYICNIGDSRAYLLSNGEIRQITKDHSYVQNLVDKGHITLEQAGSHPMRNIVTQSIGMESGLKPTIYTMIFKENDLLLLCSDGVSDSLSSDKLKSIVEEEIELDVMAKNLVEEAFASGGVDDASAIVLKNIEKGNVDDR